MWSELSGRGPRRPASLRFIASVKGARPEVSIRDVGGGVAASRWRGRRGEQLACGFLVGDIISYETYTAYRLTLRTRSG